MAYSVSNNFRKVLYSGDTRYDCQLTINGNKVPNSQISKIVIDMPIIDTTSQVFYIGTFIANSLDIVFRNFDGLDIKSGNKVDLTIGLLVDNAYEYVPIGKFLIDDLAEDYQTKCEITCLDYSTKFKTPIDYSPAFKNGKITLDNLLIWLCNYYGVELGEYPTINGTNEISVYDGTISGKQWISYIAEIKGCNAKIDRDGKLVLKSIKQKSNVSINTLASKSFSKGEKYTISKIIYFDATRNFTYGGDYFNLYPNNEIFPSNYIYSENIINDNTLYIRQDNPFVKDTNTIKNIYDELKNVSFYNLKCENYGDISLDPWDNIYYNISNVKYINTINNSTLTYEINIMGNCETKLPNKHQEVTTNITKGNTTTQYRKIHSDIDLVNNRVSIVSEQQTITNTNLNNNYYNKEEIDSNKNLSSDDLNQIKTIQNQFQVDLDGIKLSLNTTSSKVNNMDFNFTTDNLKISSSQSPNNSTLDNTGIKTYNYNDLQSIFNYNGSGVKKLIVTDSAQIGYHKILKKSANVDGVTKKMTSFYYLETLIEDIKDLEVNK